MSIFNDKALKGVAEAVTKVLQQEQLKGNQHKIDANKNGKIDAHDFKLLRGKKEMKKEEVEQIDELSTQTLSSYVKKRGTQLTGGYNDKSKVKGINKAITKVNSKKVTWHKEEVELNEQTQLDEAFPSVEDAKKRMDAESKKSHDVKKVSTGTVYTKKQKDDEPKKMKESLSFSEMLELYNEHGLKVLAPIETEEMDVDGTTIEVIDADKVNGVVDTIVEEPTNDQFTKEYEDQKASFEGKKPQPKVAAGKTTGVKTMPEEVELDEAKMTRSQKDAAVRRFMSHDPKAGESILAMGKKDRAENKAFDSAKKEINKMKKEETELDERKLTSDEMDKREDVVKSMKKNLSGFKQRYGERAKEVMYATATKMAKKG